MTTDPPSLRERMHGASTDEASVRPRHGECAQLEDILSVEAESGAAALLLLAGVALDRNKQAVGGRSTATDPRQRRGVEERCAAIPAHAVSELLYLCCLLCFASARWRAVRPDRREAPQPKGRCCGSGSSM
jgi:hypothetical protein